MTDIDRIVAGISCRAVLGDLSDFIDGALSAERVALLQAHVAACDTCARFGGAVTAAIDAVRASRPGAEPISDAVSARLRTRLQARLPID